DGLGAVGGAVEGADGDGDRADPLGRGGGPDQFLDTELTAVGVELQPQRAAVDELVQRGAEGGDAAGGGGQAVDDAAVTGDIGGDQAHAGAAADLESHGDGHLGDGRPALPIAGREPAEVGVGVDGDALVQAQRLSLAGDLATLGDGV